MAEENPTLKTVLPFWLPLAFMWLIMGVEQPIISAVVARLPNPTLSLASIEVAMGVVMFLQSPVIQMLGAATAVARGVKSFGLLKRLLTRIVVLLAAIHAIICIPPVFRLVVEGLLKVPPELTPAANLTALILLPIPAGVGFRRLYQGAMIRAGCTAHVSLVMVVRLAMTALLLLAGLLLADPLGIPGFVVGATAFAGGIVTAWFVAWILFTVKVKATLPEEETEVWSLRRMAEFYLPLALTTMIVTLSRPLLAFAIGRAQHPLASLAAWPVIQGYLFMFTATAHSIQEVVIAYSRPDRPRLAPAVRWLAVLIAVAVTTAFVAAWISGGTAWWYETVVDVPPDIFPLAYPATLILLPLMVVGVVNSVNNGILVGRRATTYITLSTVANVAVQIAMALMIPRVVSIDGARLAATILVVSVSVQGIILFVGERRGRRTGRRGAHHRVHS